MTITATYTADSYTPAAVTARYVKYNGYINPGRFEFCEVGENNKAGWRPTIRSGIVTDDEFSSEIADNARARFGFYPSYVDWPIV